MMIRSLSKSISTGPLAVILIAAACLTSIAVLARPSRERIAIPESLLADIRGNDPSTTRKKDGTCTDVNVRTRNINDPPEGPNTAVGYNDCWKAGKLGQQCINCGSNMTYLPDKADPPSAPGYSVRNSQLVDCMNLGWHVKGSCQLDSTGSWYCNFVDTIECATQGANDIQQQVDAEP